MPKTIVKKGVGMSDDARIHKMQKTSSSSAGKQYVRHNYIDHAFEANQNEDDHSYERGGVAVTFPIKLHQMLDHIENEEIELKPVVSWQPHGRCFVVHDPKTFGDSVLGRFFQQKKYQSFQRQLNLYGFRRITKGRDRGGYYHELFLRGKRFLCIQMKRTKVKGTGFRKASDVASEPNFYEMDPVGSTLNPPGPTDNHIDDGKHNSHNGYDLNCHSAARPHSQRQTDLYPETSTTESMNGHHQQYMHGQTQQQYPINYINKGFNRSDNSTQEKNIYLPQNSRALVIPIAPQSYAQKLPKENAGITDPDYDFNNMPIHPVHNNRRHSLMTDLNGVPFSRGAGKINLPPEPSPPPDRKIGSSSIKQEAHSTGELKFFVEAPRSDEKLGRRRSSLKLEAHSAGELKFFIA